MKKNLLNYIQEILQDGSTVKLIDIVNMAHAMGWNASTGSKYLHVYHELREHPELFERVYEGFYRRRVGGKIQQVDMDDVRDAITNILQRRSLLTATQIWRALQRKGIFITYRATYSVLNSGIYNKNSKAQYRVL